LLTLWVSKCYMTFCEFPISKPPLYTTPSISESMAGSLTFEKHLLDIYTKDIAFMNWYIKIRYYYNHHSNNIIKSFTFKYR
jgi:hypothetical protein